MKKPTREEVAAKWLKNANRTYEIDAPSLRLMVAVMLRELDAVKKGKP
jgi:hypothetical protein